MLATKPLNEFLDELASNSPAPGGGSVAALAAALGTALTAMVCRLTIGKKKYSDVQEQMERVLGRAEELRAHCTRLIDEDTEAFNRVMAAYAMPKENEEDRQRRSAAIQEATREAALVPLNLMKLADEAILLAKSVAEKGNRSSISDAGVAALMLQAACAGAALNVRINAASLSDAQFVSATKDEVSSLSARVEKGAADILRSVHQSIS